MDCIYCLACDCLHSSQHVSRQFTTGFRRINGVDYPLGLCKTVSATILKGPLDEASEPSNTQRVIKNPLSA